MKASIGFFKEKLKTVLRNSEQYTKTDMVYLARGGFWSLMNQGVGSLASFVVVLLLANFLPKEVFGQYRFILSIASILSIFTLPGIGTAIMQSVARREYVSLPIMAKTRILWGLLGSVAALFVTLYYFFKDDVTFVPALALCIVFLPFVEVFTIYIAYYKGKEDFKTPAIYEAISRIFQATVLIVVALFAQNTFALIGAFFIGQIIVRFFFYQKTLHDIQSRIETEHVVPAANADTIRYGKHLSFTEIFNTIAGNADKLLVWHFLGAEALAIYYVSLSIPRNLVLICNVVPRIAFPKLSKNTWEAHERAKILRKLLIFSFGLIVLGVLYGFAAPFIIPVIFKSYGASVATTVVLALLILLSPLNAMVNQILQARKFIKKIVALQATALAIFVVVFFVLFKDFGITGAAVALVAGEATALLVGIFLIK